MDFPLLVSLQEKGRLKHASLRYQSNTPVIYLLDEFHLDPVVIKENTEIAELLVGLSDVTIIGTEDYIGKYDFYNGNIKNPSAIIQPKFNLPHAKCLQRNLLAEDMDKKGVCVVGVDNYRYTIEAYHDSQEHPSKRSPKHIDRSKHFIRALISEWRDRGSKGNMVLNCGSDHNSDIIQITSQEDVVPDWWPEAMYCRIRTKSFPAGS